MGRLLAAYIRRRGSLEQRKILGFCLHYKNLGYLLVLKCLWGRKRRAVQLNRLSPLALPTKEKIPPRKVGEASSAFALPHSGRNGRHPTVRRPDKQWALLAINKDPKRAAQLNVEFNLPGAKQPLSFVGQVEVIQFSRAQYAWRDDGPNGHQSAAFRLRNHARSISIYELPPYSLTVIRGKVAD